MGDSQAAAPADPEPMEQDAPIELSDTDRPNLDQPMDSVPALKPEDLNEKLLEEKELLRAGLTAPEYAHLIILYLIKNNALDAKFTAMRADIAFPNDEALRSLKTVVKQFLVADYHLAYQEFRKLKGNQLPLASLGLLAEELTKRLLAHSIIIVSKSYSTIAFATVQQLLPLSTEDELRNLITQLGWTITNAGVTDVAYNSTTRQVVSRLVNDEFGPFTVYDNPASEGNREKLPLSAIQELVALSDFIGRQGVQNTFKTEHGQDVAAGVSKFASNGAAAI